MVPAWECQQWPVTVNPTSKSKTFTTLLTMFYALTQSTAANGQQHCRRLLARNQHLADQPAQTRRDRIGRYCKFQTDFTNQLRQDLIAILN